MDFSEALAALKQGKRIAREHWGGWWFIQQTAIIDPLNSTYEYMNKTIVARLRDNGGYVPATAYQEDLLADDWTIVEEDKADE